MHSICFKNRVASESHTGNGPTHYNGPRVIVAIFVTTIYTLTLISVNPILKIVFLYEGECSHFSFFGDVIEGHRSLTGTNN